MNKTTIPALGFGILLSQAVFSQVAIFDTSNDMPFEGMGVLAGDEVADDASLATLGATVTELELFLVTFTPTGQINADVSAALYSDNGSGAPGILLWAETKVGLSFASSQSSVVFNSIDTTVGRDFFWSVKLENVVADPGAVWAPRIGVAANATPAGASTDPAFLYVRSGGAPFAQTIVSDVDSTLGVRITGTAIPEPTTTMTLLLGTVMIAVRRRPRTS